MQAVIGTVTEKVFSNKNFAVMRISVNGKSLRVIGDTALVAVANVTEHYSFNGEYETHPEYSDQFRVTSMHLVPVTVNLIKDFLVANVGVGKNIALKLIEKFGVKLPELLDAKAIDELAMTERVSAALATVMCNGWADQKGKTAVIHFMETVLSKANTSKLIFLKNAAKKAYNFYKEDTVKMIKEDPYRLWAFSTFKQTDAFAQLMGVERHDKRRLRCAIEEVIYKQYEKGNTLVNPLQADKDLTELIGYDSVIWAVYEANRADVILPPRIIVRKNGWSLPGPTLMENYVQEQLLCRIGQSILQLHVDENEIKNYRLPDGNLLNERQQEAVKTVLSNTITCISGEAGTGKTSILFAVNSLIKKSGHSVMQVALAGKAAQRLIQQTDEEAYTITNLLSKIRKEPSFLSQHPSPVLHIDEASMVDLPTMYRVLKAFEGMPVRLVFIGDEAQLPPIGPGLIFHILLKAKKVPVITLDINYRQLAGNGVAIAAKQIRLGDKFVANKDVQLIECTEETKLAVIKTQYIMHQETDVHVIAARKATVAQCNRELHQTLFEKAPVINVAPEFRIGDSVIYKQNNQALGLVNGSVGTVVVKRPNDIVRTINKQQPIDVPADIVIDFKNEGRVPMLLNHIKNFKVGEWYLHHAYAITCHSAQGSEFDVAIIVLGESIITERSWLYTAITRAKNKVVFVGSQEQIQRIIDKGFAAEQRTVGLEL